MRFLDCGADTLQKKSGAVGVRSTNPKDQSPSVDVQDVSRITADEIAGNGGEDVNRSFLPRGPSMVVVEMDSMNERDEKADESLPSLRKLN